MICFAVLRGNQISHFFRTTKTKQEMEYSEDLSTVYSIDWDLETLLWDIGGRISHIAFGNGYTNLIIDGMILRIQSKKLIIVCYYITKVLSHFVQLVTLSCYSQGHLILCHISQHGESSKYILTTGLMIVKGINNSNSIPFLGTMIHGDPRYNDDKCFDLIKDADMDILNTT